VIRQRQQIERYTQTKHNKEKIELREREKQKNEIMTFVIAVIVLLHERLSHRRNVRDLESAESEVCRFPCTASAPLKFTKKEEELWIFNRTQNREQRRRLCSCSMRFSGYYPLLPTVLPSPSS